MTTPLSTLQRNFLEDGTGMIPSQLHPFMDKRRNREGLKGIFTLNSIYPKGILKIIAKLSLQFFERLRKYISLPVWDSSGTYLFHEEESPVRQNDALN